jgi:hypothetical protein
MSAPQHTDADLAHEIGDSEYDQQGEGEAAPCPESFLGIPNLCIKHTNTPTKLIHFLWVVTNFLVFLFFCAAISLAAHNDCSSIEEGVCSKSTGFAAIWALLMALGLAVGGSLVLRKVTTPRHLAKLTTSLAAVCSTTLLGSLVSSSACAP